MAINTLVTIKDAITAFADGHGQLQGRVIFESDDHRSAYITEENTYPLLFVAPIDVAVNRAMNVHTLRVYVYERINDDRLDVWENANDTSLILRDIRVWWNDYGVDEINIVEDPIGQFGCDKELDNLVGYFADIRFEIPSHGRCQVPVDIEPIPPEPIVCEPVDIYVGEALAGSFDSGSEVFVKVMQDGFEIAPEDIIVTGGDIDIVLADTIPCADATVNVNGAFWDSVPSGGTENVIVRQSSGSTQVGSIQGQYFRIADSTAVLKTTGGTTISTTSIKAEASANIVAPNTTIEVNGTTEGTVVAGSTVDIQLSDSGGVVTPDSVTVVGNDVQIVLPDAAGDTYGSARLQKSGVTTSYADYDAGYYQRGRSQSFYKLPVASLNPFGHTWRFTGKLGGYYDQDTSQYKLVNGTVSTLAGAFPDNIMIDWSTREGVAVQVWALQTLALPSVSWDLARTNCQALTVGGIATWALPETVEYDSLRNWSTSLHYNWSPLNFETLLWSANTDPSSTGNAYYKTGIQWAGAGKANGIKYIPTRWTLLTELGL
jgi:hypothetical protein